MFTPRHEELDFYPSYHRSGHARPLPAKSHCQDVSWIVVSAPHVPARKDDRFFWVWCGVTNPFPPMARGTRAGPSTSLAGIMALDGG